MGEGDFLLQVKFLFPILLKSSKFHASRKPKFIRNEFHTLNSRPPIVLPK